MIDRSLLSQHVQPLPRRESTTVSANDNALFVSDEDEEMELRSAPSPKSSSGDQEGASRNPFQQSSSKPIGISKTLAVTSYRGAGPAPNSFQAMSTSFTSPRGNAFSTKPAAPPQQQPSPFTSSQTTQDNAFSTKPAAPPQPQPSPFSTSASSPFASKEAKDNQRDMGLSAPVSPFNSTPPAPAASPFQSTSAAPFMSVSPFQSTPPKPSASPLQSMSTPPSTSASPFKPTPPAPPFQSAAAPGPFTAAASPFKPGPPASSFQYTRPATSQAVSNPTASSPFGFTASPPSFQSPASTAGSSLFGSTGPPLFGATSKSLPESKEPLFVDKSARISQPSKADETKQQPNEMVEATATSSAPVEGVKTISSVAEDPFSSKFINFPSFLPSHEF